MGHRALSSTASKTETSGAAETSSPAGLVVLFTWLLLCSLFVFWRALTLPFALDDLDQLHALAVMRSGRMPFGSWLMLPHNEHLLPLLRLLFWAATRITGLDPAAARIAILLTHVAGAMACALLTLCCSRNRLAGWLAGTIYAGAAGFAGSPLWEVTIAQFSMAATLLTFALVAITGPRGRAAPIVSLTLILGSCSAMAEVVVATISIPAYVFIAHPRLAWSRWQAIRACLCLQVLIFMWASWTLNRWGVSPTMKPRLSGLLGGGWLVLTAPYRFLMAWVPLPDSSLGANLLNAAAWSALAWTALVLSSRWLDKATKGLLLALWTGDILFAMLVGLGRSDFSLLTLFLTDRYYYFFLLPLSIHAAVVASAIISKLRMSGRIAKLSIACGVVALVMAGLAGSRLKLGLAIPWKIYSFHRKALSEGKALADLISVRASTQEPPREILLADGEIPFDGIHKDRIALSTLFFSEFPSGVRGVKWAFGGAAIPSVDASIENQLLDGWSQAIGTSSPVCVVSGSLRDVRSSSWIDFRKGSFENAIVRGFHGWEQTFRWMSRSGTVRLQGSGDSLVIRAHAPINLLRKRWPDIQGLRATIQANSIPIGEIFITRLGEQEFRLQVPTEVRAWMAAGNSIDVTLQSEVTWRGADVDLPDERELSLALVAIGFPPGAEGSPASFVNTCSERFSKQDAAR